MLVSFIFFLFLFIAIGALSALKKQKNNQDYLLAGRNVQPWLVALSAVATNNSGYMFIGAIGYTYVAGLSAIWLLMGFVFGDFFASLFIHKKLRIVSEKNNLLSFSSALASFHGDKQKMVQVIGGVFTIVFLGTYAAAQLTAGSKALNVLMGFDYSLGAIIGAVMILIYCFSGGIRASIWTDAAQSIVMIIAMALLFIAAVNSLGGLSEFVSAMNNVSPTYGNLFPSDLPFGLVGILLFILGWVFVGFGVIGQPHIMIRFMAMDKPDNMNKVRAYYYSWYIAFSLVTLFAGISARIILPDITNFDAELALPSLAIELLPEILVGLILAGIFAATMSTADSQILSCSAAITNDLSIGKDSYIASKLATLFIVILALFIALFAHSSVFHLVLLSWKILACLFAPLLTLYVLGYKMSEKLAVLLMFSGVITVFIWQSLGWGQYFYEIAPGLIVPFLLFFSIKVFNPKTLKN